MATALLGDKKKLFYLCVFSSFLVTIAKLLSVIVVTYWASDMDFCFLLIWLVAIRDNKKYMNVTGSH